MRNHETTASGCTRRTPIQEPSPPAREATQPARARRIKNSPTGTNITGRVRGTMFSRPFRATASNRFVRGSSLKGRRTFLTQSCHRVIDLRHRFESQSEATIEWQRVGRGGHRGPEKARMGNGRRGGQSGPERLHFCPRPRSPGSAPPWFQHSAPRHPTHPSLPTPPAIPCGVRKNDGWKPTIQCRFTRTTPELHH